MAQTLQLVFIKVRNSVKAKVTLETEVELFEREVNEIEQWFSLPRFRNITRLYSARQVAQQRGTIDMGYAVAREAAEAFHNRLRELFTKKEQITTFGPYSPGQAVAMKRIKIRRRDS